MQLINNEAEYKEWMIDEYLHIKDDLYCIFNAEELEEELARHMPREFPCIATIVTGEDSLRLQKAHFIYRSEVEQWASVLKIKI